MWGDLVETAKEAISKGVVESGKGWYHRSSHGPDHYIFYYQNGGQMQDPESGKLVLVKDALEKHFQQHMDAVKTHKITPENFMGTEGKIWHETVTAGQGAVRQRRTWTWADWIKTYKVPEQQQWDNVGYMLIPAAQKGGKPVTLSHPLVYMVTNGKNQELAFRLIAAATTPELNSKHSVESAHLAILKSQEKDPTYQKDKFLLAPATCPSTPRSCRTTRSSAPTTRSCSACSRRCRPGRCSRSRPWTWRSASCRRS